MPSLKSGGDAPESVPTSDVVVHGSNRREVISNSVHKALIVTKNFERFGGVGHSEGSENSQQGGSGWCIIAIRGE